SAGRLAAGRGMIRTPSSPPVSRTSLWVFERSRRAAGISLPSRFKRPCNVISSQIAAYSTKNLCVQRKSFPGNIFYLKNFPGDTKIGRFTDREITTYVEKRDGIPLR